MYKINMGTLFIGAESLSDALKDAGCPWLTAEP